MKKNEFNLLKRLMSKQETVLSSNDLKILRALMLDKEIPGLTIKNIKVEKRFKREGSEDHIKTVCDFEYFIHPEVWFEWIQRQIGI